MKKLIASLALVSGLVFGVVAVTPAEAANGVTKVPANGVANGVASNF